MSKALFGSIGSLVKQESKNPTALEMAERRFLASEACVTRYSFLIERIKILGGDISNAERMLKIFQETAHFMGLGLVREQERLQHKTLGFC